jgi:nitrite reductase/ring-hydroxylating ferredoxin subunit/uncharacterized membrane protein
MRFTTCIILGERRQIRGGWPGWAEVFDGYAAKHWRFSDKALRPTFLVGIRLLEALMEIQGRAGTQEHRPGPQSEPLLDRVLRRQGWMDGFAEAVQSAIGAAYGALGAPGRSLKNLMHGTTVLGHPLHPALTDIPLGAWTVGVLADWAAMATGRVSMQVGDIALAIGLAGALLSAAAGYTDFHETYGHERRTALTHGLAMTTVVVVDAISLALRWWGGGQVHLLAVVLASAAYVLAILGAYVGGHLTFGLGTMVNRNAFAEGPADYVAVGKSGDFKEGELRRVDAGSLPVLVVRQNGLLNAIGAVCSHAGGPLDEGKLEGECVICPWHGSKFRIADGRVRGGPATFDQPALTVREQDGHVEVRLAHPLH